MKWMRLWWLWKHTYKHTAILGQTFLHSMLNVFIICSCFCYCCCWFFSLVLSPFHLRQNLIHAPQIYLMCHNYEFLCGWLQVRFVLEWTYQANKINSTWDVCTHSQMSCSKIIYLRAKNYFHKMYTWTVLQRLCSEYNQR